MLCDVNILGYGGFQVAMLRFLRVELGRGAQNLPLTAAIGRLSTSPGCELTRDKQLARDSTVS